MSKCKWCGQEEGVGAHQAKCPLVKSIEYGERGKIKRVEFFAPTEMYHPVQWPITLPVPPVTIAPPLPQPVWMTTTRGVTSACTGENLHNGVTQ